MTTDRRHHKRTAIDAVACLRIANRALTARMINVSNGGALVRADLPVSVGDIVDIDAPLIGRVSARVLRVDGDRLAVAFIGGVIVTDAASAPERASACAR